ncbi:MAG: tRNA (adenosine(37)-N6)-threonylcarbamoyltransferase complex ATPase subunit type 1 TsaE [Cardiobacteriaceae bacterium]|nr:tRNA (adenosine(37)-N6)-threonylcarbamoyltransferase complex ATPase subunit type 1 TsaE [Cardiobacteriaceae bacterium]
MTENNEIKMQEFTITTIVQLRQAVKIISDLINNRGVIYLSGDLGSGKTTFTRYFLHSLGWEDAVPSPTYSLINTYQVKGLNILHADLYRLTEPDELLYLDVRDWQINNDLIFIEWAEKAAGFIPPADYEISFNYSAEERKLFLSKPS